MVRFLCRHTFSSSHEFIVLQSMTFDTNPSKDSSSRLVGCSATIQWWSRAYDEPPEAFHLVSDGSIASPGSTACCHDDRSRRSALSTGTWSRVGVSLLPASPAEPVWICGGRCCCCGSADARRQLKRASVQLSLSTKRVQPCVGLFVGAAEAPTPPTPRVRHPQCAHLNM